MIPVRTLTVWCTDWPVVSAGVSPHVPAAVFWANRVVSASDAARQEGVHHGLRRRDAQRRCPDLLVLERDLTVEARQFEPVVAAIETLTPRIEITRPGVCAVATRGPSRYFGGDDALADRVHQLVAEILDGRGRCRVGIADGPFAASLAARRRMDDESGKPIPVVVPTDGAALFLAPLPVTSLERPELTDVLARLGLTTLGAFAALPATDVLARFGVEGRDAHRLASGLDEHPPDLRTPPPDLSVSAELDPPAERVDTAAFVAKSLADELGAELAHRGLSCTRLAIEAETEYGETLLRLWRHEGALTSGAIADRVRWQLDGWLNGPPRSRPSGGLSRITLAPDEILPATGRQLGFWGGETAADERAIRALARVEGLLGADAVRVAVPWGGRGADDDYALVPASSVDLLERANPGGTGLAGAAGVRGEPKPWPGRLPSPAPATAHAQPRPAHVVDARGAAVGVSGRGHLSAPPAQVSIADGPWVDVASWAGPWPLDERWWDAEQHRRLVRFQIVDTAGVARLLVLEQGRWFEHAVYS